MSYTKYRESAEINHTLELVREMWEANNHLALGRLLHTISAHKKIKLEHLSDQQLQGYIIDALDGKFDKKPT